MAPRKRSSTRVIGRSALKAASMGCGVDIVECDRFRQAVKRGGEAFLRRVFTDAERRYVHGRHNGIVRLAARFAAKEAVFKAMSQIAPTRSLALNQIEIRNDALGRPSAHLRNWPTPQPTIHVSLSHVNRVAIACAIAQR